MSEIFSIELERVLQFSSEDLERYLNMCFDSILGVVRPESERIEILDRIEAIHKEQKERENAGVVIPISSDNGICNTNSNAQCVLQSSERLAKRGKS